MFGCGYVSEGGKLIWQHMRAGLYEQDVEADKA